MMRHYWSFILFIALNLSVIIPAAAQTEVTDTLLYKFSFKQGGSALDLSYRDNGRQMQLLSDTLEKIAKRTDCELVAVNIEGCSSPEGSAVHNVSLALHRAKQIRNHLLKNTALNPDIVNAYTLGVDLENLVKNLRQTDYPQREKLINVLIANKEKPTQYVLSKLRSLDGGKHWRWLLAKVFPEMRLASTSVVCYVRMKNQEPQSQEKTLQPNERIIFLRDTVWDRDTVYISADRIPNINSEESLPYSRKMVLALRTNLLLPLMNVGVEVPFGNRWSVGADWYYPWLWRNWHKSSEMKNCFQLLMGGAEVRYWFGRRHTAGEDNWKYRLSGHSIGVYGFYGYYDIEHNYEGYQGHFYNVGVDYMFSTRIGRNRLWRLEFTLGVGYIHSGATKYRVYSDDGHAYRTGVKKNFNWFGPTKVGVSLVIPVYKKIRKEVVE